MKLVVWVPGILGSKLVRTDSGETVWPPGPFSEGGLESRNFEQLTASLRPHGVIDMVACCPVYQVVHDLLDGAGFVDAAIQPNAPLRRLIFDFDWRMDISKIAAALAVRLDALIHHDTEITLLGHSMGGLICRYLAEAADFKGRPFHERLKQLISVNGPQAGAATMAARALGIEATGWIEPADTPRIIAAPGLSGGMNLLPRPGEKAVFDGGRVIDLYDAATIKQFKLGPNAEATHHFWNVLAAGSKPKGVTYISAHSLIDEKRTTEALRYQAGAWMEVFGDGDGTVTAASATAMNADVTVKLPGDHVGTLKTDEFRQKVFEPYIGKVKNENYALVLPQAQLQSVRPAVSIGEAAAFVLVSGTQKQDTKASLAWFKVDPTGRTATPATMTPVVVPAGSAATFHAPTPTDAGTYRVVLTTPDASFLLMSRPATVVQVQPKADAAVIPPAPPP